ncbi:hypothetical protein NQ314_020844 [Rhamnusium bicolor]|uniref:Uncharacterized protein n=1 Tax=Rhamnusium bicolor TaxID=1586634 RepID=A0AAV8WKX1_9CUCU|nr:hypothetical protein NQ314_020844 [Rhamnusium bicolor]
MIIIVNVFGFVLLLSNYYAAAEKVTYTFPEFPYKETNKNEVMFREVESACERGCLGRNGVSKVLCIRQCVSPSCYRDLYQADLVSKKQNHRN